MRLLAGLAAFLSLLAVTASAPAQDERPKGVQRVYDDYQDDGVIDACEHPKRALQRTLDGLTPQADADNPDLRPALEAAIEQHDSGECVAEEEATPTPTPESTPAPTSTPAPPPDSTPAPPPSSGGGGGGGGGGDDGGGGIAPSTPPAAGDVTPVEPAPTTVPPAATPAPTAAAPVEPTGPAPEPALVYSNEDDPLPASLLVPAVLLGLLALAALAYAVVSRLGWADGRLSGVRRAWREAAFRAGGTWGDFADWMRPGR
jgi:hypothetical protein